MTGRGARRVDWGGITAEVRRGSAATQPPGGNGRLPNGGLGRSSPKGIVAARRRRRAVHRLLPAVGPSPDRTERRPESQNSTAPLRVCRKTNPARNGPAAQSRCEFTGSSAAPCFPTCRLRSGSRQVIRCGGSGNWRIMPSIDSIPPYVSCTHQKAGHRFRPSSCYWPRCCRRSTGFAPSVSYWSSCTKTCCSASLSG